MKIRVISFFFLAIALPRAAVPLALMISAKIANEMDVAILGSIFLCLGYSQVISSFGYGGYFSAKINDGSLDAGGMHAQLRLSLNFLCPTLSTIVSIPFCVWLALKFPLENYVLLTISFFLATCGLGWMAISTGLFNGCMRQHETNKITISVAALSSLSYLMVVYLSLSYLFPILSAALFFLGWRCAGHDLIRSRVSATEPQRNFIEVIKGIPIFALMGIMAMNLCHPFLNVIGLMSLSSDDILSYNIFLSVYSLVIVIPIALAQYVIPRLGQLSQADQSVIGRGKMLILLVTLIFISVIMISDVILGFMEMGKYELINNLKWTLLSAVIFCAVSYCCGLCLLAGRYFRLITSVSIILISYSILIQIVPGGVDVHMMCRFIAISLSLLYFIFLDSGENA